MDKLTDKSRMPQRGKHHGHKMEEIPAAYLLWIVEQSFCLRNVKQYVEDNRDVLENDGKTSGIRVK